MSDQTLHYTGNGRWRKIGRLMKWISFQTAEKALWMYYALMSQNTPKWAKLGVTGALVYCIWPADAVPDFASTAGYTDDAMVFGIALVFVAVNIDKEIREQAAEKMKDWLGKA